METLASVLTLGADLGRCELSPCHDKAPSLAIARYFIWKLNIQNGGFEKEFFTYLLLPMKLMVDNMKYSTYEAGKLYSNWTQNTKKYWTRKKIFSAVYSLLFSKWTWGDLLFSVCTMRNVEELHTDIKSKRMQVIIWMGETCCLTSCEWVKLRCTV